MKVLQINCVFQNGSTGKIVCDIHNGLHKYNIDSYVLYGRGTRFDKDKHVQKVCSETYSKLNNVMSRCTGIMYGGCYFSTKKMITKIREIDPDIVHLHCINGYFVNIYKLLGWLAQNRIKTVITQHAEFFYTGGCGYAFECNKWKSSQGCTECPRWKTETRSIFKDNTHLMWERMKEAFEKFDDNNLMIVSVSPWLDIRTAQSAILGNKQHTVVLNGINTKNVFRRCDSRELRKKLAPKGEKIILHVTPNFVTTPEHNKGGYFVLELAKKMQNSSVKFVVVGNAEKIEAPDNIVFIGKVDDQHKLAEYYSTADITLLTSKRETYSMVCAESLSCGTPVVGFKAGAPEKIALSEYSTFVEYGDLDKLQKAVEKNLKNGKDNEIEMIARKYYDRRHMVDAYVNIYQSLI